MKLGGAWFRAEGMGMGWVRVLVEGVGGGCWSSPFMEAADSGLRVWMGWVRLVEEGCGPSCGGLDE